MFESFMKNQIIWSTKTFGRDRGTEGLLKHIEEKIQKLRDKPDEKRAWLDIVILALDGYWRAKSKELVPAIFEQSLNYLAQSAQQELEAIGRRNWFQRKWPALEDQSELAPVKHLGS